MSERRFPIQQHYERGDDGKVGVAPYPTSIPWHVADLAYSVYSNRYGRDQSLERLAERGGFGPLEMNDFLPNWRELAEDAHVAEAVKRTRQDDCAALEELRQELLALSLTYRRGSSAALRLLCDAAALARGVAAIRASRDRKAGS